jgi:uncharacterized membrane protein
MEKTIRVEFRGTNTLYDFRSSLDLKTGDAVVCDTIRGLVVGNVVAVLDTLTKNAVKMIVDKVDMDNYNKRLEIEKRKRMIKDKMVERRKEIEEKIIYKTLAEVDPMMAKLLNEYEKLEG